MTDGTDDEDADEVTAMYDRDNSDVTTELSSSERDEPTAESDSAEPDLKQPKVEAGGGELEEITGTFYVKYAQEKSVTLHEVDTTQICTLIENPGFERHEIVEATLKEQPPMGVSYLVEELDEQYSIPVEESPESPTKKAGNIGAQELDVGDAIAFEREGKGEIHVLSVEPGTTAETVEELVDDEMTYKNAARYEHVDRVEIRRDDETGVVTIRYLP